MRTIRVRGPRNTWIVYLGYVGKWGGRIRVVRLEARLAEQARAAEQLQRVAEQHLADSERHKEKRMDALAGFVRERERAEAAEQRAERLAEALRGTRERELADGPCWCPDWMAEDWRDDDPLDERVHHNCCLMARKALAGSGAAQHDRGSE